MCINNSGCKLNQKLVIAFRNIDYSLLNDIEAYNSKDKFEVERFW